MNGLEVILMKTGKSYLYVDLRKVEAGTKIHAYTENSKYLITTRQRGSLTVRIEGGKLERPWDMSVFRGAYNAQSGNILNNILCENCGFEGVDIDTRQKITTSPVCIIHLNYPDGTQMMYWGTKIPIENSIFTNTCKSEQKHAAKSIIN